MLPNSKPPSFDISNPGLPLVKWPRRILVVEWHWILDWIPFMRNDLIFAVQRDEDIRRLIGGILKTRRTKEKGTSLSRCKTKTCEFPLMASFTLSGIASRYAVL